MVWRIVSGAILSVVGWITVIIADPFGIDTAANVASVDFFKRVYSFHYPTENQDNINVVIIDEDSFPLVPGGAESWPPKLTDYATILSNLSGGASGKPRAIFVDLFIDRIIEDESEAQSLCDAIISVQRSGVPVIFAALPDFEADRIRFPVGLSRCGDSVSYAMAGWQAEAFDYPTQIEIGGKQVDLAAMALYRAGKKTGAQSSQLQIPPIQIMWGAAAPLDDESCKQYKQTTSARWINSFQTIANGLLPDVNPRDQFEYIQPGCLFHSSIPVGFVGFGDESTKEFLGSLLDNSYVFLGANLPGIPDLHNSPVHGIVPGVFRHSMALDNLLTFEKDVVRRAPTVTLPFIRWNVNADILFLGVLFVSLAIVLSLVWTRIQSRGGLQHRVSALLLNCGITLVFAIIVVSSVLVAFSVFRWLPESWGSLLLAGTAMIFGRKLTTGTKTMSID